MNISNIFQQKMVSQTNPFGSPKSALNQALGRINNNILQNINLEATEKLKLDIYIPETNNTNLENITDGELEIWSMELRCGRNSVTPQIEAFREQLKGIDQTIQDYEKMLNGEMEMPTKLAGGPFELLTKVPMTKEDVQFLLAKTKAFREEFIKDGVKQLNSLTNMASGLVSKGGAREKIIEQLLGENPLKNIDKSAWTIDANAADIYSELDKAQEASSLTHDVTSDCRNRIIKEMKKRGLGFFYEPPEPEVTEKVPDTAKTYESMIILGQPHLQVAHTILNGNIFLGVQVL